MTLELQNVRVQIGGYQVLRGIDLTVPDGQIIGLTGRNGAGKTTTLRAIMGLLDVQSGTIHYDDHDFRTTPAHQRASLGIGYMPEDRRLINALSVEENILVPAWATEITNPQERLARMYEQLPIIKKLADRQAVYLSGGEQKLVAFARALMTGDNLLILDEPFEGVASALRDDLGAILHERCNRGIATLITSTDSTLSTLADRVYTIERGDIVS
jgi:branched-chain amino acid transport system ATP-binding protein